MQGAQKLAWADNAIKLAVDLTVASLNRVNIQGTTEQQAEQLRAVMAVVVPEAATLLRRARAGRARASRFSGERGAPVPAAPDARARSEGLQWPPRLTLVRVMREGL